MQEKERKEVKRSLKSAIDKADKWILMASLGDKLGATELPNESVEGRKIVITELERAKQQITDNLTLFMKDLDDAINQMK